MVHFLILLVFLLLFLSVAWWILGQLTVLAPFRQVVNVIFGLVALILLFWIFSPILNLPSLE